MRWIDPDTWHLTLVFLGDTPVERIERLCRLIDDVCIGSVPYDVETVGGGGRTRGRDGVAWLRLGRGADDLIDLAGLLAMSVDADGGRTPSAHLTTARRADDGLIAALRDERHGPLRVAWRVEKVALVRSHLTGAGAAYETLYRAPL